MNHPDGLRIVADKNAEVGEARKGNVIEISVSCQDARKPLPLQRQAEVIEMPVVDVYQLPASYVTQMIAHARLKVGWKFDFNGQQVKVVFIGNCKGKSGNEKVPVGLATVG